MFFTKNKTTQIEYNTVYVLAPTNQLQNGLMWTVRDHIVLQMTRS